MFGAGPSIGFRKTRSIPDTVVGSRFKIDNNNRRHNVLRHRARRPAARARHNVFVCLPRALARTGGRNASAVTGSFTKTDLVRPTVIIDIPFGVGRVALRSQFFFFFFTLCES